MNHATQKQNSSLPGDTILRISPSALVVLIGPTASGKSSFAAKHFKATQIISSDTCRALIADDEADQEASRDAFRLFHRIISERLKRGLLTVADSTALTLHARSELLRLAMLYNRPTFAIVFSVQPEIQRQWNQQRHRHVPAHVLTEHRQMIQQTIHVICNEGFNQLTILRSPQEIDRVQIRIGAYFPDQDHGPFDLIGDVHGCYHELTALLTKLGYTQQGVTWTHPERRCLIFVGDVADRGPANIQVWQLILNLVDTGNALLVPGNHDNKLMRWLMGHPVRMGRGLDRTIAEIEALPMVERHSLRERILTILRSTQSYLILDNGKLIVTHAGIRDEMIGRWDRQVNSFCLYGDVAGFEKDGLPIRRNWAADRNVSAQSPLIVYGHVVVDEPAFINETVDIDTGCCFGGSLTALRYPERTFVSIDAQRVYATSNES
jgi:protein phosphatase